MREQTGKPHDTVLLDVDGTLIDSNDAHARAWVEALEAAFDDAADLLAHYADSPFARYHAAR